MGIAHGKGIYPSQAIARNALCLSELGPHVARQIFFFSSDKSRKNAAAAVRQLRG